MRVDDGGKTGTSHSLTQAAKFSDELLLTKGEINHTLEYLYLLEHVDRLRRLKGR